MCIIEWAGSDDISARQQFSCSFCCPTCLEFERGARVFLEGILGGPRSILRAD
jgi:hypothetical protein